MMYKLTGILASLILFTGLFAQVPEKMSYQAVIRNSEGRLVQNSNVGIRITILEGSISSKSTVFSETHNAETNANGLLTLEIGTGESTGDFSSIDWSNGSYFLMTEIDPEGGTDYSIVGISQLLSVPYALYAKTAEQVTQPETDPVFSSSLAFGISEDDTLNWNSKLSSETDPLFISSVAGGISSEDTVYWNNKLDAEKDSSVTNEIQTILRSGLMVTLSKGGGTFIDSVNTQRLVDVLNQGTGAGNHNITNLADPIEPKDAVNKRYVDALLGEISAVKNYIQAGGPVCDIDGNTYLTTKIGNHIWMAENLKTTTYNDGTPIPNVTDNTEWVNLTTGAYCWYDNDETDKDVHGALYNWEATNTGNLCPTGWHIPTPDEFETLPCTRYSDSRGSCPELKVTGDAWTTYYGYNTNESGFSALPAGIRQAINFYGEPGSFRLRIEFTFFWASDGSFFTLSYNSYVALPEEGYEYPSLLDGYSVRCVKDYNCP